MKVLFVLPFLTIDHIIILGLTFRRCLQKNNIFLAIVFGELFENLQLLPQPKLQDMDTENFQ